MKRNLLWHWYKFPEIKPIEDCGYEEYKILQWVIVSDSTGLRLFLNLKRELMDHGGWDWVVKDIFGGSWGNLNMDCYYIVLEN